MKYILFFFLLFIGSFADAATTVTFEPTVVALGESAQLIIESDRPIEQPDFSGLVGNFAVAGQQQGVKTVVINGRRRTKYSLALNVFPRKTGSLSTGELTINGAPVQAAVLTVETTSQNSRLPVLFTATASQSSVYPQETFLLTIKLTAGVLLMDAKIMPPTIENAQITVLDMDKTYQTYENDKQLRIFERTFAVTPQKEGDLTIPPIEIYALVGNNRSRTDLFSEGLLYNGLLGGQKEVRLESNPIQVTVLEKPENWTGWWLPATQVSVKAEDSFPEKISVGDSLTRIIKLNAMGVQAEQLPNIVQGAGENLKVYPSPEQRETIQTPVGDIQGISSTSIILIPTEAGELTIPEVRIPWFNTQTRQIEEAILPEKKITVMAAPAAAKVVQEAEEQPTPKTKKKPVKEPTKKEVNSPQKQPESPVKSRVGLYWVMICSSIALMVGLGLGFILFRKKHPKSYRIVDKKQKSRKEKKKPLPDLYPF